VTAFLHNAEEDMGRRMFDGLVRGWGTSWQDDYPDEAVLSRLDAAVVRLNVALDAYRGGRVEVSEVRTRAADVANQAFMLADPFRLMALER
jgi:hypothetical protein